LQHTPVFQWLVPATMAENNGRKQWPKTMAENNGRKRRMTLAGQPAQPAGMTAGGYFLRRRPAGDDMLTTWGRLPIGCLCRALRR